MLDEVDLEVAEGTIFALLGPNGAGKTTIVRILSTLIRADAGDIRVAGHDVAADPDGVRAAIGVTGQFSAVDNLLTGEENLQLMADLRHLGRDAGRRRVAELLERFDLTDAAGKPLSTYSGGMRRRLDLAMTLVGDPRLIFLDEPTTGLDPRSRRTMWQIIERAGRAAASRSSSPPSTWRRPTSSPTGSRCSTTAASSPTAPPPSSSAASPAGTSSSSSPTSTRCARPPLCSRTPPPDVEQLSLQVSGDGSVTRCAGLLNQLDAAGIEVEHLSIHTPDLDDVFFAVTGRHRPTDPPATREKRSQP